MREHDEDDPVDFVIVGTGAGGGTLACKLAEHGFSVVACDAGPYFRPLEDFASDESEQAKLYWTDDRIVDGNNPLHMGSNNSGKAVGGSTVHFAMVSLRFRPEWFKSRSLLGYGADWPLDWREMWAYYAEVEQALKISGPINYPWGPPRPRYPYRAHESMPPRARSRWAARRWASNGPRPRWRRIGAARGLAHPCVYRGFCVTGCSTNAKQSALITWIPRAIAAGAEIRDLAMVGKIETDGAGLATGVQYSPRWPLALSARPQCRRCRLRHRDAAAVAQLATDRFPDGLANSSGLVGKNLMAQSNQAVWGELEQEVRSYKGPPSLAITEHWNYEDKGKDFFGGYSYMSQGPLPQLWANTLMSARGLWGAPPHPRDGKVQSRRRPEDRGRDVAAGNRTASRWPTTSTSTDCASRASPIRGVTTTKS